MHTAPNPKAVGTNVRRAWHAGANQPGGNAGGNPVPHVLLRLPRIGADEPLAPEPSSSSVSNRTSLRVDPPVINNSYAGLQRELAARERSAPGPLTDFHGWLANGGKVWLTIVALLVANGVVLLWRQSPAPQVVAPTLEEEHSALQPVPLDDSMSTSDQTASSESLRPSRTVGEPTLAPPRPEPDALNAPTFDEPVAETEPVKQEPTLAPSRPEPTLARREPTLAPKQEQPTPAEELPVATSEPTTPTIAPKATATKPMPAVGKADAPKEDVPPWESWNDEKSEVVQRTPPTEDVTKTEPTLAPPQAKAAVEAKTQPPEPRTAAVTQATPTVTKPKSVAKLKGKINKPLSEPGHEHTRRSLY